MEGEGEIAREFKKLADNAFRCIGQAYYAGVRDLKNLRKWLVCNYEVEAYRWVRLNPKQALTWLQNQVGE